MRNSRAAVRRGCRCDLGAFTLIELLAVITIILILAGLILSVAGYANNKGAKARAQGEIQAMSTALESYKADNGTYPESSATDSLNAASTTPPDPSTYITAGETLYQALSGIVVSGTGSAQTGTGLGAKSYYNFTPGQLGPSPTPTPSSSTILTIYVVDPFGLPYGYSTSNYAAVQAVANGSPAPNPTPGYNPTYDLWSTAGYGNGSNSYPTSPAPTPTPSSLWIKNW